MTVGRSADGWIAVRRDDGETVGYLEALTEDWSSVQPRNRLGHPVGAPTEYIAAEDLLIERGIAELAEPWRLDGGDTALSIAQLSPGGIVLRNALFAKALIPTDDIVVPWPDVDGRLERA
ncbi:hypothetical protein ET445_05600 [Agromyces protaetiae]|uniref:Uncharacterized protein n=1 Tax=Agromyces protaetiae TaxID=2509455 RepID=A0A4P6FAR1_9MICO|nr:hypothetical protein [Agromyces protaetiae]QAY72894.1 hypothetical protein ET445_05600 [Agromyces protaetiae]